MDLQVARLLAGNCVGFAEICANERLFAETVENTKLQASNIMSIITGFNQRN